MTRPITRQPSLQSILRPFSSDYQPVVITPIPEGQPPGQPVNLELRYRPKDLTVVERLRYSDVHLSGVDERVVQIHGVETADIRLEGKFSDRNDVGVYQGQGDGIPLSGGASLLGLPVAESATILEGRPSVVNLSREKSHELRRLFRLRQRVRLEWGSALRIEGLITEVEIKSRRESDMDYALVFMPLSMDEAPGEPKKEIKIRQTTANQIIRNVRRAANAVTSVRESLSRLYLQTGILRSVATRRLDPEVEDVLDEPLGGDL